MKLFVWDFHGTLERGTEYACIEFTNNILQESGYSERCTEEQILMHYGKKWRDIFREIVMATDETYKTLEEKALELTNKDFHRVKKHLKRNDHIPYVLEAIRNKGHKQILISNTSEENLDYFLLATELNSLFPKDKRFATTTHDGENPKINTLRWYLDNSEKRFTDIITIGDRDKDIELVHVAG